MSSRDRWPYRTATTLDQALLDACADNFTCQLELVCDVQTPTGMIHVSDRNKFVGSTYYEARTAFPTIQRTLGDWLANELEFSSLQLEINNADGAYNHFLPAGDDFGGWIGKTVTVKMGLRDVASTYKTIFEGIVTEVGGMQRSMRSITLIARNSWDKLKVNIPATVFTSSVFSNLETDKEGLGVPLILGDWTTGLMNSASVPSFPVNGADVNVVGGSRNNVQLMTSSNVLSVFDTTKVYLRRGQDTLYHVAAADVVNVGTDKNTFEIAQNTGNTIVEGANYLYDTGDEFFVQVKGPTLSGFLSNPVEQAKYLLKTYGGLTDGDFDSSWATYRDKSTPVQSAIASIPSRVWVQEAQPLITYVLSLLEQVRLDAYVTRDAKLALSAVHFEDWDADPSFTIETWDVAKDTLKPALDEQNNFNRAQGQFNFEPIINAEAQKTPFFKNSAAITQAGKATSKILVFPNLYVQADVENQVREILRLASAYTETVDVTVTWRALLQELGGFVKLNPKVGSTQFDHSPAMIRRIGYNPDGLKLELQLWSFQMFPFPGWNPGYAGIVSGYNATITQE